MLNGSYPHLKAFANDHAVQFETAWLTFDLAVAPLGSFFADGVIEISLLLDASMVLLGNLRDL